MVLRLFQALIVVFWGIMTFLLVRLVFFPEETRLNEVPPEVVLDTFLSRRVPSELVVLNGNTEVGSVTLSSKRLPEDVTAHPGEIEIFLAGIFYLDHFGEDLPPLRYAGKLWVDHDARLSGTRFELRVPGNDGSASVEYDTATREMRYRVIRSGEVVLDSAADGGMAAGEAEAQARLLLEMWGVPLMLGGGLPAAPGGGGDGGRESLVGRLHARQGSVEIRGNRFSAYLLDLPFLGGETIRLVFTKSGELMKADGVLGYEIVSDILVPLADRRSAARRRR